MTTPKFTAHDLKPGGDFSELFNDAVAKIDAKILAANENGNILIRMQLPVPFSNKNLRNIENRDSLCIAIIEHYHTREFKNVHIEETSYGSFLHLQWGFENIGDCFALYSEAGIYPRWCLNKEAVKSITVNTVEKECERCANWSSVKN